MLHARRIFQFWLDGDESFTEKEIKNFFSIYPHSGYRESLYAILGDAALHQGHPKEAWSWYAKITTPDLLLQTRAQRWFSLYQLREYALLYQELSPYYRSLEGEGLFYFAESGYQQALHPTSPPKSESRQECLLQDSFEAFERLSKTTDFAFYARWRCAEILHHQGNDREAAALYLEAALIEDNPERLFFAASFLVDIGEYQEATPWLARITKSGGSHRAAAAFAWLRCLVAQEAWSLLRQEKRMFLTSLDPAHIPLYYFYLGMDSFHNKEFNTAVELLTYSITGGIKPPYDQPAAMVLLEAARQTHAEPALDLAYRMIEERYPQGIDEAKWLMAMHYIESNQPRKALPLLDQLVAMSSTPALCEEAAFTRIHLLMDEQEWSSVLQSIESFLLQFPFSKQKPSLIECACSVAMAQLSLSPNSDWNQLIHALQRGLRTPGLANESQQMAWYVQLAKALLIQHREAEAIQTLLDSLTLQPHHPEATLWLALAYAQSKASPSTIIATGEAACQVDREKPLAEEPLLHLALFNAYLAESQVTRTSHQTAKAADHLEQALMYYPIALENRFWLIHYYAKQHQKKRDAIRLLEEALLSKEQMLLNYPEEVLLLASLYQEQGDHQKVVDLLLPVHTKLPQPKLRLLLSMSYEVLGYWPQACCLIQGLEHHEDPTVSRLARLHQIRIQLAGKGTFYAHPLEELRHLWQFQQGETEPVHLEAALDYLEEHRMLYSLPQYIALVMEIRYHFTSQDDLYAKEYHAYLASHPEKQLLHDMYVRWLDIQIYLNQAALPPHHKTGNPSKHKAAQALLSSLQECSLTPYLKAKIDQEFRE